MSKFTQDNYLERFVIDLLRTLFIKDNIQFIIVWL